MSTRFTDPDRQVVPRWRPSWITARLGEMSTSLPYSRSLIQTGPALQELESAWLAHRTPTFAADFVGAAFVSGEYRPAEEAARQLLQSTGPRIQATRQIARRILGLENAALQNPPDVSLMERRKRIHALRGRLGADPRNAFAWTDLAREYTILAQFEAAERAIRMALLLTPHDRFVLRSAVRFYLHWEDEEQAHDLLRRNTRTPEDPWLLASEIAAAELAGRGSRLVRKGRTLIPSSALPASHTAELASAIATLEMKAGSNRQARRLFEQALRDPNENAIAQASWAARRLHAFEVKPAYFGHRRSFEASAWKHFYDRDWDAALAQANEWQLDEPFASRPALFGSFVASVVKNDPSTGVKFARRGLAAEPTDATLLNNLSFSLASMNDAAGARAELNKMHPPFVDVSLHIAYLATSGLVSYREGNPSEGRRFYAQAVDMARGEEHTGQRLMGFLYQAREEIRYDIGRAETVYREAITEVARTDAKVSLGVSELFGHLVKAFAAEGVHVPPLPLPAVTTRNY